MSELKRVAVVGNPNVGKTTIFNRLTGSKHRVGNYPGMTVEQREGTLAKHLGGGCVLVDLPGTYSLSPVSEDEAVAFRALRGRDGPPPDGVMLVIDATNLARNLYFALQVLELGLPTVVALNMVDVARTLGSELDPAALGEALGCKVVGVSGRSGEGLAELAEGLGRPLERAHTRQATNHASSLDEFRAVQTAFADAGLDDASVCALLCSACADTLEALKLTPTERACLRQLDDDVIRRTAVASIEQRYARVDALLDELDVHTHDHAPAMERSERVDAWLTHPVFGVAIFVLAMAFVFVAIFSGAEPMMGAIESGFEALSSAIVARLGPGLLTDLLTEGVVAGVGNVLVFVPQIALLFLFLGLLEDSGYLARAAFLLDRSMSRLGLHGRAFIPLLSGYACAVPAILGTRTISSWKDRLVTMLMIPYMSCSARLPIYSLVLGALFVTSPQDAWISPAVDRGLLLLLMYSLGTAAALLAGLVYKRTILASPTPPLVLELPPYRIPRLTDTLRMVLDKLKLFIKEAGTVILACTIVLWALLSFPRAATGAGEGGPTRIEASYAGRVAHIIEPVVEPIGQDWRVGLGILGSFAAREVLVSTLGLAYGMEADDDDPVQLREALRQDRDAAGNRVHSRLSGLALMVFFVFACQCMSTIAVVRRETGGWRWPVFMFVSMTLVAYIAALVVFQGGRALLG